MIGKPGVENGYYCNTDLYVHTLALSETSKKCRKFEFYLEQSFLNIILIFSIFKVFGVLQQGMANQRVGVSITFSCKIDSNCCTGCFHTMSYSKQDYKSYIIQKNLQNCLLNSL